MKGREDAQKSTKGALYWPPMRARFFHRPLNLACSADEDDSDQGDGDLAVAPAKPKLKRPPLYRVVLLNDDYTPMEFVVQVLEQFFAMEAEA